MQYQYVLHREVLYLEKMLGEWGDGLSEVFWNISENIEFLIKWKKTRGV